METPHFLRLARSLALGAGLLAGCSPPVVTADAGGDSSTAADTSVSDSSAPGDGGDPCATCSCGFGGDLADAAVVDSGQPTCDSIGQSICCAAIGPLPPPELAAERA
ncbi:MAG: hypothetical protein Q8Q09_12775 [Deltaproteobacteria bacterium]|nr:hypothetical protein [Deltaproteobacteria bacterium]